MTWRGRLVSSEQATDGQTYPSSYKYNLAGMLVEQTYPSGRVVQNVFDNNGDISIIRSRKNENFGYWNYAQSFEYTASGVIKHLRLGNGLWESAVMNSRNQVLELRMGSSETDGSLMHLTYDYGEFDGSGNVDITKNAGNIARQRISFNGLANPFDQTYKYDSLDRITEAKETVNGSQTWIQQFGYDRYGNRTSHSEVVQGQSKPINEVTLPSVNANTNRFSNTTNYQYDAVGNLIRDVHGRQFTFNGDNKQTEVKDSLNNVIGEYVYDGNGKRIKKITASEYVIFVYDGIGKLIAEYSTDGPPQNPMVHYTATDPLGSPRVITNENGEVLSRRDFMPFGEEITPDTTFRTTAHKYGAGDSVRQKFTGYERDDETGLDFAEARYYYNNHGRFTAVDPLLASGKSSDPQSFNRYVYVLNMPLKLIDPEGLKPVHLRQNNSDGQLVSVMVLDDEDEGFQSLLDSGWQRVQYDSNGEFSYLAVNSEGLDQLATLKSDGTWAWQDRAPFIPGTIAPQIAEELARTDGDRHLTLQLGLGPVATTETQNTRDGKPFGDRLFGVGLNASFPKVSGSFTNYRGHSTEGIFVAGQLCTVPCLNAQVNLMEPRNSFTIESGIGSPQVSFGITGVWRIDPNRFRPERFDSNTQLQLKRPHPGYRRN